MMQNKIWSIIKHEYLLKIKSKGFIIGTILMPLGFLLFFGVVAGITYFSMLSDSSNKVKIAINDKTNKIATNIIQKDTLKYFASNDNFDVLKDKVLHNEIQAAVFIEPGIVFVESDTKVEIGNVQIFINEKSGLNFLNSLQDVIKDEIKNVRLLESGIDVETLNQIYAPPNIKTDKVTEKGVVKDDTGTKTIISYIMGFAMYMMMIIYGSMVMQGVIEEKQNRIVEVLASSVSPFQIMFGKVVGIGAVGLTQVLFWIILVMGMLFFAGNVFISGNDVTDIMGSVQSLQPLGMESSANAEILLIIQDIGIPSISIWHILSFIFYFLSGYFIFATLFAAAGSTVDQIQDANSISMPLTLIVIIPIMMISPTVLSPEGTYITIFSLFPFFAPILMVARIMTINIPLWQVLLSIVLQIGTFILCLKVAGKIYRRGMLRYGKKATYKEVFNWLKG